MSVSARTPNAFSKRIAISADSPALPFSKLLVAWRVTWSRSASAVTLRPTGSTISARSHTPG
jgi:hypothetical protein